MEADGRAAEAGVAAPRLVLAVEAEAEAEAAAAAVERRPPLPPPLLRAVGRAAAAEEGVGRAEASNPSPQRTDRRPAASDRDADADADAAAEAAGRCVGWEVVCDRR